MIKIEFVCFFVFSIMNFLCIVFFIHSFLYLAPLDKETEMLQIYRLVWVPNGNNVLNVSCLSVKK